VQENGEEMGHLRVQPRRANIGKTKGLDSIDGRQGLSRCQSASLVGLRLTQGGSSGMSPYLRWISWGLIAVLVLAGCASAPERKLSTEVPSYAVLPSGENPLTGQQVLVNAGAALETLHGRPLQVLMLSGGGQNGAFGAGVLKGWQESGTRPKFDAVTGISTGALIATFAFLGEPQDDEALAAIYTGIDQADVYQSHLLGGLLFGGSALMDTAPLKRLIDKYVTAETLARVAAEHDKGRVLAVGATNLDRNQLWVFLLSRLAHEGGPQALETYRRILLAAASPPVVFPPVELFGYLFGDGATVNNLLIAGLAGKTKRFPPSVPKGQLWLIHNGRLSSPAEAHAVRRSLFPLFGKTLTISMDAHMGSSIVRAYAVARVHDYGFNLVEVPEDVKMGSNALAFDHEAMVRLYDAGLVLGRRADAWTHEPPATPEVSPQLIEALKKLPPLLTE
jgi:hypothetical protein